MTNIKTIIIGSKIYSLTDFANKYNLSYSTVRKYYKKGLRGNKLLEKVRQIQRFPIIINGHRYANRHQAAKAFNIPTATFYRKYKSYEIL